MFILAETGIGASEIIAIITAVLGAISTIIAIIQSIKKGNWKKAATEGGQLLDVAANTIDTIKSKTDGSARAEVSNALADAGGALNTLGLKDKMDAKLKELGLDDKS